MMLNRYTLRLFIALPLLLLLSSAWAKPTGKAHEHSEASAKTGSPTALTTQQIARLTLPSIVRLTVLDASGNPSVQGSGIVVGKNLLATNVHVIKNAHAVTANFQNGRSEAVYGLVAMDEARDLALIYADTSGIRELPLAADGSAQIGDPVVAVGSPEGLGGSLSTGIVSAIRFIGNTKVIQTTAPISPGSSGGALLDIYGHVLGVTSFDIREGQNLNFAYASYQLRQLFPKQLLTYRNWSQLEPLWAGAVVIPPPSSATQADLGLTNKPLIGLKGVAVTIEDLRDNAIKDGLDTAQIKIDVELRLRKSGIPVFDQSTNAGDDSGAFLYVNINPVKLSDGSYSYSIMVELREFVRLTRPIPKISTATTWDKGTTGYVNGDNMPAAIRQYLNDNIDGFTNDYLAQNPKP